MSAARSDIARAKFAIGEIVHHKLFDYRGVIIDADADFMQSSEWYEKVARSRPPKDQPWYHVLVHETDKMTYVAERNLAGDDDKTPVSHPLLERFFSHFSNGQYLNNHPVN